MQKTVSILVAIGLVVNCLHDISLIDKGSYVLVPSDFNPSTDDDVVTIMTISDTHNIWTKRIDIDTLPNVDILIHSGDITMIGNLNELKAWNNWINQYLNIDKKAKYAIIISGNHDLTLHEPYYNQTGYKHRAVKRKQNTTKCMQQIKEYGIYLKDEGINLMNIKFFGSPWTPYIGNWAFGKHDNELQKHWETLNEYNNNIKSLDILITHGPPHGILDYAFPPQKHVGDKALLNKIRQVRPKYHIFGHIHEGYGVVTDDETIFINAAMLDEKYKTIHKPIVFYFKHDQKDKTEL